MPTVDKERGLRLMLIRKDLNETQTQFAKRFNSKTSTISGYEQGRMPDDVILRELSLLGYSIDWLLTGEGTMKRADRRPPGIVYPDPRVVQDFSILRDAPPSEEKSRRLLILMKELVCEFLNDPPPEGVETKDPKKGG